MILTDDPAALRLVRGYYRRRLKAKNADPDKVRAAIAEITEALRRAEGQ